MDGERKLVYDGAVGDRAGTADLIVAFMDDVDGNDGQRWYENVRAQLPDGSAFTDPEWDANFLEHCVEGLRPEGQGRGEDSVAGWGPWDFSPEGVATHVHLWCGARDAALGRDHAEYLAENLPSCTLVEFEDGDHNLLYPYWDEILSALKPSA